MLDQQARLSQTQMQLSLGKKILTPTDDPVGAARVIDLNQGIKQTEQYQNNISAARQRLSLEDGVLQDAVNVLHRIKELGVQGLNATNSQSDRTSIAVEMKGLNEQLLGLANTRNANGEYLFSGYKTDTPAFSKNGAGGYVYNGDANQRSIQIATDRRIADGDYGSSVFGVPTGSAPATATSPVDNVFEAIDKFAANLQTDAPQGSSLDDIASALEKMLTTEASVGVRMNALDRQEEVNSGFMLETQTLLSATQDLDFTEAISRVNLQTVSLQAAQQAFTKVQNLSLFKFL
jgi:flagellar hook-associated protein 3 FlgL